MYLGYWNSIMPTLKLLVAFFLALKNNETLRESEQRKVIINDIKLFSQIHNRKIDAYITKDRKSLGKMIEPLKKSDHLNFEFIDLVILLKNKLGKLF